MTYPGSLGGFPGNWSFRDDATLVVGDYNQRISVSLHLEFIEETEIDVKLVWEGVSDEKRLDVAIKMPESRHQIIVIQQSIILVGFFILSLNMNNGVTNSNITKLITYSSFPQDIDPCEGSSYFVQLRAYLNDDYSMDDIWGSEFENMPQLINRTTSAEERHKILEENLNLYCALNSGYEVKCGKKHIKHKDHSVFHRRNIKTLYQYFGQI